MNMIAYEGTKPYIFISYAHKDAGRVLPILEALAEQGFRIWYDAGIEAGTEWPEYIATHLKSCSAMLAFVSRAFDNSQNCRREINYGISKNKSIVAVYLESFEMSDGMELQLGTLQSVFYERHASMHSFLGELVKAKALAPCLEEGDVSVIAPPKPVANDPDFVIEDGVLTEYKGAGGHVVIPDGVTEIGEEVFSGRAGVVSVTFPGSMQTIGAWTFFKCPDLTNIIISDGVTRIDSYAFGTCGRLTDVTLPDSLKSIGMSAFSKCDSLRSIILPKSVTDIDDFAFGGCGNLSNILIPSGVTSMGKVVFYDCWSLTVYCEADRQPYGWNEAWNSDNLPVVWGYKE